MWTSIFFKTVDPIIKYNLGILPEMDSKTKVQQQFTFWDLWENRSDFYKCFAEKLYFGKQYFHVYLIWAM